MVKTFTLQKYLIFMFFTYILHHITGFTFSFAQLPVQPQLRREDKDHQQLRLKQTHRHKNLSETSPSALREIGSRAVWSRQGQTVARHPEVLPLCLCTATRCNLLL